jgi:alkyl hydroperoxide reductase subunit AhpC
MEKNIFYPAFMIKRILKGSFLLFLLGMFPFQFLYPQGYEIKFKIPPIKDSNIILGHHFGDMYYPDDTVKLDAKGTGTFKKPKPLAQGMYFVYLPNKKVFDILLGQDQTFSMEVDTTDFAKSAKITGSLENELFYNHMRFMGKNQEKASALVEMKKNSTTETQKDSITKELDKLNKEVLTYLDKTIKDNKGTFFAKFLLAMKDVQVPEAPRDTSGKMKDSTFQYRYYKKHYFDNMDYTDPSLLRTPVYEKKMKDYIEKVVPQMPDSINTELDILLNRSKSNDEVFRYLLVTFFNMFAQSQIMGFDAVFVHLAENYYIPFATWQDKEYMDKLKKEVAKRKPTLIGNIAPNLKLVEITSDHFLAAKTDTTLKSNPYVGNFLNIHDVKAKYTILMFWDADCGHCKHAVPEMHKIYQDLKSMGVKVMAIHTVSSVEGKRKWIDFVNENQLYDWINLWSPYSLEFRDIYDVYSTPVILVLDENKKIIAKRINPDQVKDVVEFSMKR